MRIYCLSLLLLSGFSLVGQSEDVFISHFSSGYQEAIDLVVGPDAHVYLVEKGGRVYRIDSTGTRPAQPWIDIHEEVTNWKDHGLMAICLDDNYLYNGYVYLLYAVDPYWEAHHSSPDYVADSTITFEPTWGRIARFQADAQGDFSVDQAASRHILLGETAADGIPIHHQFHGLGKMVMASDRSLIISSGDGAENNTDVGDNETGTLTRQAIEAGILAEEHHIGSWRAQHLGSLQGKMLRIDPHTGEGLSSNPFYNSNEPRAARSRIWALGLRNPYRFELIPNTGSHEPEDGNPGTLVIGDVGNGAWEELNICHTGGQNFGWPIYEGMSSSWAFSQKATPANSLAPNPLYGQNGCDLEFFDFRQTTLPLKPHPVSPGENPCDSGRPVEYFGITTAEAPILSWSNRNWNPPARAATLYFDASNSPRSRLLDDPESPVEGENFSGTSSLGGFLFDMPAWPEFYQGKLVFYDYSGPIQLLNVDEQWQPWRLEDFENIAGIHTLKQDSRHNRLYFLTLGSSIGQITFGGNPPPVAHIDFDRQYGQGDFTVNCNAYESGDPNDDFEALDFRWSVADGSTASGPTFAHHFVGNGDDIQNEYIYLTVSDPEGKSDTDSLLVSINNSPPQISITSFEDGDRYPVDRTNLLELTAEVSDNEHPADQLAYEWQVYLHHNDHYHPEPIDDQVQSKLFIGPPGCEDEIYFYRVRLRVTDPSGLYSEVESSLYPDCEPAIVPQLTANPDPQAVHLQWVLPTRVSPNDRIDIQRGREPYLMQTISTTTAAQTEYDDLEPLGGSSLYRIKITSTEGVINYSNLETVNWPGDLSFTITPNPTTGPIQIRYNDPHQGGHVYFRLYTADGRLLHRTRWETEADPAGFEQMLTFDQQPPGIYLYEIETGELRWRGKLVIVGE